MTMISNLPLVLDRGLLEEGIKHYIGIDFTSNPHAAIVGPTNSGKSYLTLLLEGRLSKYVPDCQLYIADFKNSDDYHFLNGIYRARYASHLDCGQLLDEFGAEFENRLNGSQNRKPIFLIFDEYSSFIEYTNMQNKHLADKYRTIFSNVLFLGRSLGVHIICSTQRPDSVLFNNGAREQFGLRFGLSVLSTEARRMIFSEYSDEEMRLCGTGQGYLAIQGTPHIRSIVVPTINDMDKLHRAIKDAVTR